MNALVKNKEYSLLIFATIIIILNQACVPNQTGIVKDCLEPLVTGQFKTVSSQSGLMPVVAENNLLFAGWEKIIEPGQGRSNIVYVKSSRQLFGSNSNSIWRYDEDQKKLEMIFSLDEGFKNVQLINTDDAVWAFINVNEKHSIKILEISNQKIFDHSEFMNDIVSIDKAALDKNGDFWLLTIQLGGTRNILQYNPSTRELKDISAIYTDLFKETNIMDIGIDENLNLWVSEGSPSGSFGLEMIQLPEAKKSQTIFFNDGFNTNSSIVLDRRNRILISDFGYLDTTKLQYYDPGFNWTTFVRSPVFIVGTMTPEMYFWARPEPIFTDSSDRIWFEGYGIVYYEEKHSNWCRVSWGWSKADSVTEGQPNIFWILHHGIIYQKKL